MKTVDLCQEYFVCTCVCIIQLTASKHLSFCTMGGIVLPVVINKYVLLNFVMLGTNKSYTHGFVNKTTTVYNKNTLSYSLSCYKK